MPEGDPVIGLFMKIPFHAQIRNADPRLAAELSDSVDGVVSAFAASRQATEESFLLTFDESSRPCRLRAAEAARCLSSRLAGLGSRLHGWALLLDSGAGNADEALSVAKRMWYGIQSDGMYISARSKAYFSDYFFFGPMGAGTEGEDGGCISVLDAIYARPTLPAIGIIEEAPSQSVEKLIDALGELGVGQDADTALAILGPGRGPSFCLDAALAKLYPDSASRFLRLRASAVEGAPYGPIAGAFANLISPRKGVSGPASLLSGAERGLLEELAPMLDFLLRSPYRRGYSTQVDIRLRLCTAAALRFYAREMRAGGLPAFVILEGIELFPEQSLSLVLGLFEENLSGEGIMMLAAGAGLPDAWKGAPPRSLEIPGPSPQAIAQAALRAAEAMCTPSASTSLALAAAGDPQRLKLAMRLLASGRPLSPAAETETLASETLATFPREYAELLLALALSEEVLTDECEDSFLSDSGYVPGVRVPVFEALAALGFISREERPRIASALAARRVGEALPDGGKAMRGDFARRLVQLREEGRILSSAAFYRRLAAEAEESGTAMAADLALVLDCISTDATYGPSDPKGSEPIAHFLEPMIGFLKAYAAADRDASLAAKKRLEAAVAAAGPEGKLAKDAAMLVQASFEYAEGRVQGAAMLAKQALMGLHSLGARKAEAKAHRLLGLCSLAQEQVQDGADYLSNAYEIAEAIPEPLECILSATSEAAADFALGDLGRAVARSDTAASWAAKCFRADWESAAAFIKGRAALEIGRCERAEECFGRVRTIARVYGQTDAARRAEIWTGRAAAFAGELSRARDMLARFDDDVEALWFLAELEYWEGSAENAIAFSAQALALDPRSGFSPADSFDWSSGFASLEGRAVGFVTGRSYLRDQVEAFVEFAAGMAAPESEARDRAARLASMAREDRLAALHPAAHLYLFYRYLILERATPSSMDGAAALSKAFKALQMRSMHMGEASLKNGFLESNRWNRDLLKAARSRKLI
jgi:tetratricopeptide (TPR) repeat protein